MGDRENASDQDEYSEACQDVDGFMWDHPDFLLVFAAGNSGPGAGTVGSPSVAKSVLAVGATERGSAADSLTSFSSRVRAADGRLKPDLSFPGANIQSSSNDGEMGSNNCGEPGMSGTSMASLGATGLAVLVCQHFADGFHPSGSAAADDAFEPSAALLKATMIGAAVSMTDEDDVPSMEQGWGRVQLDRVLAFWDSGFSLYADDHLAGFESPDDGPVTYAIDVLGAHETLSITLAYTDYPSSPAASTNLVNDVDLELEGRTGRFGRNLHAQRVAFGDPDGPRRPMRSS